MPGGAARTPLPERRPAGAGPASAGPGDADKRSEKLQKSSTLKAVKRWFFALGAEPGQARAKVTEQLNRSPIILAAVDVDHASDALLQQLRETVRRIVLTEPGARLACVSVMRINRIGVDDLMDGEGRSRHVKQLVALKHWARPISKALNLDEGRLTFHVLEASDAAAALLEFAQRNQADHVVMGARGSSSLRRLLGSVSSQVVAQSNCTVTVVRSPGGGADDNAPAPPTPAEP